MDKIKKHLLDDEEVIWTQKPKYPLFSKIDLLTVPICVLLFGGISLLFTLYLVVQFNNNAGAAFYFLTAGLLVYIISFYFIFGRFLYRKKRRSREEYIITNKRAIIITSLALEEAEAVFLNEVQIKAAKNSVFFGEQIPASDIFYNLGLDALLKMRPKRTVAFLGIENPDELIRLCTKTAGEGDKS